MIAQGVAGQVARIDAEILQPRDDVLDEVVQPPAITGKPRMKPSAAPPSAQRTISPAILSGVPTKAVRGVAVTRAASRRVSPFSAALALMRSVVERKLLWPTSPSSGNGASSG